MLPNSFQNQSDANDSALMLDYAHKQDFAALIQYINKDEAMAQIYLEEAEQSELTECITSDLKQAKLLIPKSIRLLLNGNGKTVMTQEGEKFNAFLLVLRKQTKLIGFVEMRMPLFPRANVSAELFSLYVAEDYRNKGLASLLMAHQLQFFINSQQGTMYLRATAKSLPLYIKFGFYPEYFESKNGRPQLPDWLNKGEEERIDDVMNEYLSLNLYLDLSNAHCKTIFLARCSKCSWDPSRFVIHQRLKDDLQKNFSQPSLGSQLTLYNSCIVQNSKNEFESYNEFKN